VRSLISLVAVTLLSSCALPQTTVRTGSTQPSLVVKGAPDGSTLFVDGLQVGPAKQYDGNPKVLAVLEGAHKLEIRQGTDVIFREKAFVSSGETHTVTVIAGGAQ
jgi:hypothetical protein